MKREAGNRRKKRERKKREREREGRGVERKIRDGETRCNIRERQMFLNRSSWP